MTRTLSQGALRGADELSVVICAMAGDDDAYGELVRRRQSSTRQLFRRLCRNPALADDLAQQTFMQAWRSIATLKSPAAFGGWLRRLAINTWLQRVRVERPLTAIMVLSAFVAPYVAQQTLVAAGWFTDQLPATGTALFSPIGCVCAALFAWRIARRVRN